MFRPLSPEHPDDETFPGLLMLRVEGRVFFANVAAIGEKIKRLVDQAQPRVVALDLSGVSDLEYTALKMLTEAEQQRRREGMALWLVGLGPEVLATVQRSSLGDALGRERMHFNLETAVGRYQAAATTTGAVEPRPAEPAACSLGPVAAGRQATKRRECEEWGANRACRPVAGAGQAVGVERRRRGSESGLVARWRRRRKWEPWQQRWLSSHTAAGQRQTVTGMTGMPGRGE